MIVQFYHFLFHLYIQFANFPFPLYNETNKIGEDIMDNRFDLHVYTNNTKGGNDKVSFLCETAVAKGLRAVAFTDRCDIDLFEKYDSKRRLRHSYFDMARAKGVFFDSLSVFCGIEFTQAYTDTKLVSSILEKQEYDIVLSSVTRFPDAEEFGLEYGTSQEDFNDFALKYTALLKKTVEETDFDVLSKPLSPLRNTGAELEFFRECMKGVLTSLAHKEKALELNTKDLLGSDKVRDLYTELLVCFKQFGGKYVVIGSESNFYEEIGNGLEIAFTAAKMAGFSSLTLYDKRIPYLFDL